MPETDFVQTFRQGGQCIIHRKGRTVFQRFPVIEVSSRYVTARFCLTGSYLAPGCVQLPLEAAERSDSQHLAYGYYLDGQSENDPRRSAYESRRTYYKMITAALDGFDELVEQLHSDGRDVNGTPEERTRNEAYEYALNSTDELFLMNLYDWYLETGKSDRLLEVRGPQTAADRG